MFDKEFQKGYQEYGAAVFEFIPKSPAYPWVNNNLVAEASQHLYGAIQVSCREGPTAKKFLRKYKYNRDGIMTWIEIAAAHDKSGSAEVHRQKLEAKARRIYTNNYKGGLTQYLEDITDAFAGLEEYDWGYEDDQKKQILINNLQLSGSDNYLRTECRKNSHWSYEQCYEYLRGEAAVRSWEAQTSSYRKANKVTSSVNSYEEADQVSIDDVVERVVFKLQGS